MQNIKYMACMSDVGITSFYIQVQQVWEGGRVDDGSWDSVCMGYRILHDE
jgi:hypothetical protein